MQYITDNTATEYLIDITRGNEHLRVLNLSIVATTEGTTHERITTDVDVRVTLYQSVVATTYDIEQ